MTKYHNVKVIGFECLNQSASSKNEEVLELRVGISGNLPIRKSECQAWPLSRFFTSSLVGVGELILLDFWSLINEKAEQQL